METYKNSYTPEEDYCLWELHEIRHKIHKRIEETPIDELNKNALDFFNAWKLKANSAIVTQ